MLLLPWPSGPHVAGYQIIDSKQKKKKQLESGRSTRGQCGPTDPDWSAGLWEQHWLSG